MSPLLRYTAIICLLLLSVAANGEVIVADASGFTTRSTVVISVNRRAAWRAAINDIDRWWNADHTVSGDAARLSLSARPQGCFLRIAGR